MSLMSAPQKRLSVERAHAVWPARGRTKNRKIAIMQNKTHAKKINFNNYLVLQEVPSLGDLLDLCGDRVYHNMVIDELTTDLLNFLQTIVRVISNVILKILQSLSINHLKSRTIKNLNLRPTPRTSRLHRQQSLDSFASTYPTCPDSHSQKLAMS